MINVKPVLAVSIISAVRHLLILALLVGSSAAPGADTYPRQPGVDAIHYVFRLTVGDASDEIVGDATVTVKFVADGLREVVLDLTSALNGKGMKVSAVSSGPLGLTFLHESNRLRVQLPSASKAGAEFTFTVSYRGVPGGGLRLINNIHGERTVFSENWPDNARQWLPMIDHPSDKATSEFVVTAPAHYQVVANGLLIEEVDLPNNLRQTHWKQSVPIASWLNALGVARFYVHHAGALDGIQLQSWLFPQDREAGTRAFEDLARRSFSFFVEHVGPYSYEKLANVGPYSYEKLANVEAAGLNGATEHASAIFYGEKGVTAGNAAVVHETAHQWFGNSVTERDWDDVWLSEGFATYFALLFSEHDGDRDAFVAGLKRSRSGVLALEQKLPDTPVIHRNLSDMGKVLNRLVYEKGGWTLHMLRAEIGTEAFWIGIREYYRRYRNANVSTAEFRAVMEQASGRHLDWFFAQWLTRPGVPRLEGTWRYDSAAKRLEVSVSQTQSTDPYRLTVDIGIVSASGTLPRIERMQMDGRSATASFASESEPTSVVLDPNTWLLYEAGDFSRTNLK